MKIDHAEALWKTSRDSNVLCIYAVDKKQVFKRLVQWLNEKRFSHFYGLIIHKTVILVTVDAEIESEN